MQLYYNAFFLFWQYFFWGIKKALHWGELCKFCLIKALAAFFEPFNRIGALFFGFALHAATVNLNSRRFIH